MRKEQMNYRGRSEVNKKVRHTIHAAILAALVFNGFVTAVAQEKTPLTFQTASATFGLTLPAPKLHSYLGIQPGLPLENNLGKVPYTAVTGNALAASSSLREIVLVGSSLLLAGVAVIAEPFGEPPLPDCLPCPRSDVPSFDRWVIHDPISAWQHSGRVVMAGFTLYSWVDLLQRKDDGFSHVRASAESVILTLGITQLLKDGFRRRRPVFFTDSVAGRSPGQLRDDLRSFPSGDTAVAFALAASYLMSRGSKLNHAQRILAASSAIFAGIARIAGGKHFPTDVAMGALIGTGTALLVHKIRF